MHSMSRDCSHFQQNHSYRVVNVAKIQHNQVQKKFQGGKKSLHSASNIVLFSNGKIQITCGRTELSLRTLPANFSWEEKPNRIRTF